MARIHLVIRVVLIRTSLIGEKSRALTKVELLQQNASPKNQPGKIIKFGKSKCQETCAATPLRIAVEQDA